MVKAGDILFVRGSSLLSRIIRFFDPGKFSHVAIAVSETHVLEAQYFTRSRITPIYFTDFEIIDLDLTDQEREHAAKVGAKLVGKWYDYGQALAHIFNRRVNNPNHLICSEMVGAVLYSIGEIEDYSAVKDLTPNELYGYLKALN